MPWTWAATIDEPLSERRSAKTWGRPSRRGEGARRLISGEGARLAGEVKAEEGELWERKGAGEGVERWVGEGVKGLRWLLEEMDAVGEARVEEKETESWCWRLRGVEEMMGTRTLGRGAVEGLAPPFAPSAVVRRDWSKMSGRGARLDRAVR